MTPTLEEQKKECLIRMKLSGLKLHNPTTNQKVWLVVFLFICFFCKSIALLIDIWYNKIILSQANCDSEKQTKTTVCVLILYIGGQRKKVGEWWAK